MLRILSPIIAACTLLATPLTHAQPPCDEPVTPAEYTLQIGPGESVTIDKCICLDPVPPQVDVVFAVDLTGSMGDEANQLKAEILNIIDTVRGATGVDVRFGLVTHEDYPLTVSSCLYGPATYGMPGEVAFRVAAPIGTSDATVQAAINAMTIRNGGDLAEPYGRVLWELTQPDSGVNFRPGALKVVVMFNDSIPHACILRRGLSGCSAVTGSTGTDPGRDHIPSTADDIDFYDDGILGLKAAQIEFIEIYSGFSPQFCAWADWAADIGGIAFQIGRDGTIPDNISLPDLILDLVIDVASQVQRLEMVPTADCPFIITTDPPYFSDIDVSDGATLCFRETITVPADFPLSGLIECQVNAVADGAIIGTQTIRLVIESDLSITKSATPDPVAAGGALTYELTARNDGPSDATNVVVTESLPGGLVVLTADASAGTFDLFTNDWLIGSLATGSSATLTLNCAVAPSVRGVLTNSATISSAQFDPDPSDNTASAAVVVTTDVDLQLSKNATPNPATAGEPLTFNLTLHNAGQSSATSVIVNDPLPAPLVLVSASASQGAYVNGSWSVGTLAPGQTVTLALLTDVPPNASGSITNTATAAGNEPDANPLDNTASVTVPIGTSADLAIAKGAQPAIAIAGRDLTYTLTVHNNGPSDAAGVSVLDVLPETVTYVSDSPSQGAFDAQTGIWTVGNLPAGGDATLTIVTHVAPDTDDAITNLATVSATTTDPDMANNSATVTTPVVATVDLELQLADTPDPVVAGQTFSYSVTVMNHGPSLAPEVVTDLVLPAGISIEGAAPQIGSFDQTSGRWTIGTLQLDERVTLTLDVRVAPTTRGVLTLSGEVGSTVTDDFLANNSRTENTTVRAEIDLVLTKTVAPEQVPLNENVTYELSVTNNGPSSALPFSVVDVLPTEVQFIAATPAAGSFDENTGVWSVPSLDPQDSATLTITARVVSTGVDNLVTNVATAVAGGEDEDLVPDNNTASATVEVVIFADLAIEKFDDRDPLMACNELTYTLVARNLGDGDATGVRVTDNVPAGTEFRAADASKGNYNPATGVWTVGNLAVDESATLALTVFVGDTTGGQLVNVATINGSDEQFDPDTSNNMVMEQTQILPATNGHGGQKGSLVILPRVELRWDAAGNLIGETFITLSNDGARQQAVKIFYIHGDGPAAAGDLGPNERAHTGWNVVDTGLTLTPEEAYYWPLSAPIASTLNQRPALFTRLDPDATGMQPGRPDPLAPASGERVLRGAVLILAVDPMSGEPVRNNRLAAKATFVRYDQSAAAEYDGVGFQLWSIPDGGVLNSNGRLRLGADYQFAPDELLFDIYGDNSSVFDNGVTLTTELSLLVLQLDLTGQTPPATTLAFLTAFNQNEVALTWDTQNYCVECWRSQYLGTIAAILDIGTLQTNRALLRIDGAGGTACTKLFNNGSSRSAVKAPLLGLAVKRLSFGSGRVDYATSSAVHLPKEAVDILFNPSDPGGEGNFGPPGPMQHDFDGKPRP